MLFCSDAVRAYAEKSKRREGTGVEGPDRTARPRQDAWLPRTRELD